MQLRILKRWTRAGVNKFLEINLIQFHESTEVLVIGGHGPILKFIEKYPFRITTLDINPNHKPDFVYDLADKKLLINFEENKFDLIIAMEVLEHIPDYLQALKNISKILKKNGVLLGSTPWIIPMHDIPNDFHRFTYFEILRVLRNQNFESIKIHSRGNFFDALIAMCLRGLFEPTLSAKILSFLLGPFSLILPRPKLHENPSTACIGYVFSATMPR